MHRLTLLFFILLFQCQPKETSSEFSFKTEKKVPAKKASSFVDLKNKGIGPIKALTLGEEPDTALVNQGKLIYDQKCTACHKVGSTFIGPPPDGILNRRTPEWVMNMLLNTDEMLQKDSLAKALFMEFNGQLMTNQNLGEGEARAILEYFRTL